MSQISKCPRVTVILSYWEASGEVSKLRYKSLLYCASVGSYCSNAFLVKKTQTRFLNTRPQPAFGRRAQNGSSGGAQSGSCKNLMPLLRACGAQLEKLYVTHRGHRITFQQKRYVTHGRPRMTFQQKRYVTHGGPRMTFQMFRFIHKRRFEWSPE